MPPTPKGIAGAPPGLYYDAQTQTVKTVGASASAMREREFEEERRRLIEYMQGPAVLPRRFYDTFTTSTPNNQEKPMTNKAPKNIELINLIDLDNGVQTVTVRFDKPTDDSRVHGYTYKCSPELHAQLSSGDAVVLTTLDNAPARIGWVSEVDDVPNIEPGRNSNNEFSWVVSKFDTSAIDAIKERQERQLTALSVAESKRRIRAALDEMPEDVRNEVMGASNLPSIGKD